MIYKKKVLSAGRWTAFGAIIKAVLFFLQTIILARLLSPNEFGIMAIASGVLLVSAFLSDGGISRVVIQEQDISQDILSNLFWANIILSLLFMVFMIICGPFFTYLFKFPELTEVFAICSLSLPISAAGQQFRVIAEKKLKFSVVTSNEIVATVLGMLLAVYTAWLGCGVFSLAMGSVFTSAINSISAWLWLRDGYMPKKMFKFSKIKPHLIMGAYFVGESLVNTIRMQTDIFIAGLISSSGSVGLYSVPRDLCLRISNTIINPIVTRVSFPAISQIKNDMAAVKKNYLLALRIVSSINFPFYALLAIFSQEIILIFYGEKWNDATQFLQIFSIWGMVRCLGNPSGSLVYAMGRARLAFFWNMSMLIVYLVFLFVGACLGNLEGVALSMLFFESITVILIWRVLVYPICRAKFFEYIRCILPALFCIIFAALTGIWVKSLFTEEIVSLCVGASSVFFVYTILSCLFNKVLLAIAYDFFKFK